mmetsp:Transcript_10023/g.13000  ORF Transcript_10023/g.13000 Transcript_10023/m.13000 type:complete len:509 (+) Transcript_10023:49-1575(+)
MYDCIIMGTVTKSRTKQLSTAPCTNTTKSTSTSKYCSSSPGSTLIEPEFVIPQNGIFLDEYFRNNKAQGVKNIQCFPKCISTTKTEGVHKVGKSCAGCTVVKFNISKSSPHFNDKESTLYAFARFTEKGEQENFDDSDIDDGEASVKKSNTLLKVQELENDAVNDSKVEKLFHIGSNVCANIVHVNQHCTGNKLGPIYRGEMQDAVSNVQGNNNSTVKELFFKFKPRTWHYAWRGGRYRKSFHAFQICLCVFDTKKEEYRCIASKKSHGFTILSNRTLKNRQRSLKQQQQAADGPNEPKEVRFDRIKGSGEIKATSTNINSKKVERPKKYAYNCATSNPAKKRKPSANRAGAKKATKKIKRRLAQKATTSCTVLPQGFSKSTQTDTAKIKPTPLVQKNQNAAMIFSLLQDGSEPNQMSMINHEPAPGFQYLFDQNLNHYSEVDYTGMNIGEYNQPIPLYSSYACPSISNVNGIFNVAHNFDDEYNAGLSGHPRHGYEHEDDDISIWTT